MTARLVTRLNVVMRGGRVVVGVLVAFALGAIAPSASADAKSQARTRKECAAAAAEAAVAAKWESLREGKYERARAVLIVCSRNVCPKALSQLCAERLRALDAATPTVIPRAKDEKLNDLPGARVTLDGAQVAIPLDGRAFPVDPGEHLFRFEVAGGIPVEKRIVVRRGEKERVIAVVIHAAPPTPPVIASASQHLAAATLPIPTGDTAAQVPAPAHAEHGRVLVSLGLGAIAIASGVIGEFLLLQPAQQATAAEGGQSSDLFIARAFLVGAVALALGGAATWLFSPTNRPRSATTTWLAPLPANGGGALYVGVAF